jgi:hypothetical protein
MTEEGPLDRMLQHARTVGGISPSPASGGDQFSCPSLIGLIVFFPLNTVCSADSASFYKIKSTTEKSYQFPGGKMKQRVARRCLKPTDVAFPVESDGEVAIFFSLHNASALKNRDGSDMFVYTCYTPWSTPLDASRRPRTKRVFLRVVHVFSIQSGLLQASEYLFTVNMQHDNVLRKEDSPL